MYEQSDSPCFDPNTMPENTTATTTISNDENGFSHHDQSNTPPFTPIDHLHHDHHDDQPQIPIISNNNMNQIHDTDITQSIDHIHMGDYNPLQNCTDEQNTWVPTSVADMSSFGHYEENHHNHNHHPNPNSTTDLLTLLQIPRCSFAPSTSSLLPPTPTLTFGKPMSSSGLGFLGGELNPDNASGSAGSSSLSFDPAAVPYDPLFHLNLPPQPSPLLRDLMFQSLPHGYGNKGMNGINGNVGSLFGGGLEEEGNIINGIYDNQDGDHIHHHLHRNGMFEFSRGDFCLDDGKDGKCPKNFVTERQRRQNFNDKYTALRKLVPNPTKGDRASIVGDAIEYIQELKRTVSELKLLVDKKRISTGRTNKRRKKEESPDPANESLNVNVPAADGPSKVKPDPDQAFCGSAATQLRSSWLQRKCKDTEVDVRIVDDEVTIKLVQRKKINCLLSVSRSLDDLQLDLRHVAGGHVGDYYSYLFNTKICEGSSVYASAIANKLIEVVERQYASASVAIQPTSPFDFS